MFWIKFILIAALLSVVLVLGLEFSTLHTQLVTVNYLLGTATLELAWVIVGAFAAGVLISADARADGGLTWNPARASVLVAERHAKRAAKERAKKLAGR